MPSLQQIEQKINTFAQWLFQSVLTASSIGQFVAIALVVVVCWWAARKTHHLMAKPMQKLETWHFMRLYVSAKELMFLFYAVGLMWVLVMAGIQLEQNVQAINTIASLLTAWTGIRILSCVIKSRLFSKLFAWLLWFWAALNILGVTDEAITLMDSAAFNMGQYRFSAWVAFKGFVIFSLLLWFANTLGELLNRYVYQLSELTLSQKVLFNKVSKIAFVTIAILLSLSFIGVDLMALTVFSGALGLGIGIGLQKVFSNLLSGFVLLLDKSVKPGDVIAIGETYGWVNKLSTRHVSVLTRDGKEHLIPNENFISEKVENWSYSDDKIRIHIPVGIAYESDIKHAKEILLEAVSEQARILDTPQPVCIILGFGESSVDFELRAWISDPENGVRNVISAIYESIWYKFKEADIHIPFPQRDIHIRSGQMAASQ